MSNVLYIEGFNEIPDKVRDFIDKGYTIYNAPRPLLGHECWQGDFRHGVFYAAVAPAELDEFGDAPAWHKRNQELDGSVCEIVSQEAIMAYGVIVAEKYHITLADVDYNDLVQSYLNSVQN